MHQVEPKQKQESVTEGLKRAVLQQETKLVLKQRYPPSFEDRLARVVVVVVVSRRLTDSFLLLRCRRCLQVGCGWSPSGGCSWANAGERNVNTHRFWFFFHLWMGDLDVSKIPNASSSSPPRLS